jgi:hypothetical protein
MTGNIGIFFKTNVSVMFANTGTEASFCFSNVLFLAGVTGDKIDQVTSFTINLTMW